MKKFILAGLSLFIMGAAHAQDRNNQEYKDGMDDAATDVGAILHNSGCITGRNVLALAPFQFTENGWGFGASYERTLGHQDYVSFYLPVMYTVGGRQHENYGYYNYYNSGRNRMFYAMPGIKFYPTHMGKVKYALGPSLVAGFGRRTEAYPMYYSSPYYSSYPAYYGYEADRALLGVMINNSINFNPTPHLHLSAEFGLGYSYLDRVNGYNRYNTFLTQGNFRIGYRF